MYTNILKKNDWNANLQFEDAFANKTGYEGVQLIDVRYGNQWDLDDCQLLSLIGSLVICFPFHVTLTLS